MRFHVTLVSIATCPHLTTLWRTPNQYCLTESGLSHKTLAGTRWAALWDMWEGKFDVRNSQTSLSGNASWPSCCLRVWIPTKLPNIPAIEMCRASTTMLLYPGSNSSCWIDGKEDCKEDQLQQLKEVFNIKEGAVMSLALFDPMWDDYLDVCDPSDQPDKGKLQATVTNGCSGLSLIARDDSHWIITTKVCYHIYITLTSVILSDCLLLCSSNSIESVVYFITISRYHPLNLKITAHWINTSMYFDCEVKALLFQAWQSIWRLLAFNIW